MLGEDCSNCCLNAYGEGHSDGYDEGRAEGAADERARIVAWLTAHAADHRHQWYYEDGEDAVRAAAAEIEAGEHLKGGT